MINSAFTPVASSVHVERLPVKLVSDDRRVITLPFARGTDVSAHDIVQRVSGLSDRQVGNSLAGVLATFEGRHENIETVFDEHYQRAAELTGCGDHIARNRQLLIGSFLTMEYSIESAALLNPSIVPHPDQSGLEPGTTRFVMSLRAIGEGHVSSIVFCTCTVDGNHNLELSPPARRSARARLDPDPIYLKGLLRRNLEETGADLRTVDLIFDRLPERFSFNELKREIEDARAKHGGVYQLADAVERIEWLVRSNYSLKIADDADVSEIVLFPQSTDEFHGIEDLRMVHFREDDGALTYYGTYTAYSGQNVSPMLMETKDFKNIQMHTLNGACARNKGLALFPRKINGHYCMCSRIDSQNLYIMYSDFVHFWEHAELMASPVYPWELMLIGNCGSPIETPAGWLLLTHGVGPMRRYCIGAMLLDLDNPGRIIGRLAEPLIVPAEEEREGYVPNVVYTCGAMVHRERLYIPYAMSDTATGIAWLVLEELIEKLLKSPPP